MLISRKAHLILPTHRLLDAASETAKGKAKIGSTLKGIGPTYMDKTGRNGLRVGDIELEDFKERYRALADKHEAMIAFYDVNIQYNLEELEKEFFESIEELKKIDFIDVLLLDSGGWSRQAEWNKYKNDIKVIIIDYLQLMNLGNSTKTGNREQEISIISRNLKALAKELSIPVIALSQLSRAVETRGGSKRPLLSDLRESGAIEQDADIVSFIYRPEYYKIDEWDDEQHTPSEGQAEFIIAKHRNGGLENIRLKFIGHLGKFDNLDDFDSPFDTEFHSKMNAAANDDTFKQENFRVDPSDAFGDSNDDTPY